MEKKVMVVKFVGIEYALWQPGEIRFQPFGAHQAGQLDMIEAIIVWHVGGHKLCEGHTPKKQEE